MHRLDKVIYILIILWVVRTSIFKVAKGSLSLDPFTIIQILLVFAIFFIIVWYSKINIKPLLLNSSFNFLFYTYLLGVCSFFWSALPAFSVFMAFQNIVFLLAFFYIFSTKTKFQDFETLFIRLSFSFIFIDIVGQLIQLRTINFFFNWHNLETGGIAAVLLCYSIGELAFLKSRGIYKNIRREKILKRTAIISIVVLFFSASSGANVSAIAGIMAIFFFSRNSVLKAFVLFMLSIILIFPEIITQSLSIIFPDKGITDIKTFGSRTHLWEAIFDLFKQKPILGWGYAAVERIGERYNVDSHNSFLGVLGGLGIVGATFFVLFVFNIIKVNILNRNIKGYWGVFGATICLLVDSNTFGFLTSGTSLLTLTFFMLCTLSFYYKFISIIEYGTHIQRT